ncbi:MAG TPA: hypothetical protein DCL43_01140, partial [Chitinophagaceae bacterium]|nr:hypothetical protein [Chitinophagaceae bacterium]
GGVGNRGDATNLAIGNTAGATTPTIRFMNDATNNTIRYITLTGSCTNAASGILWFGTTADVNGNDANTIDNCDLNGGGIVANVIYALGTTRATAANNSGIIIQNNRIRDQFIASTSTNGMLVSLGNTDWTITGNHFYQTATRTYSGSIIHYAINISSAGTNFTISNNFIGGGAESCGGTAWTLSPASVQNRFIPIACSVGTTTASNIQGNKIANIRVNTNFTTTAIPSAFTGIYLTGGLINVGTTSLNLIGDTTTTGNIIISANTTNNPNFTTANGIGVNGATTTANIENNRISGMSLMTSAGILRGIWINNTSSNNTVINNNLIGSNTTAFSMQVTAGTTNTNVTEVTGILQNSANGTFTISNNTLANLMTPNSVSTSTLSFIRGIVATDGTNNITGNTLKSFTSAIANTSTTAANAAVQGVQLSAASGTHTINNNTITALNATSATQAVSVSGIINTSGGTVTCNGNKIYSIGTASSAAAATVRGIHITAGTGTYANNMIRLGIKDDGTSYTNGHAIYGIDESNATNTIAFNTIYIGGTGVSTNATNTVALLAQSTSNTRLIRNNMLVNDRQNTTGGTGLHIAAQYAGTLPNPAGLTLSNNIYFANTDANTIRNTSNSTNYTVPDWLTASGVDASSIAASNFSALALVNAQGSVNDVNLRVTPSLTHIARAAGITVTGITTDADGQLRGLTPDIGADEFLPTNTASWVGNTSSVWSNTANWKLGTLPTATAQVDIASTAANMPALDANTTVGDISFLGTGASLSINNQQLTLNGAVTGNGTLSGSATSDLVIGGAAGSVAFTSGSRVLRNLTLNTNASLTLATALTITGGSNAGALTVNSGATLSSNGNLTLASDGNGTATVANSTGTITGNVTAQRFLPARSTRKNLFLASPVTAQINNAWQQQIHITGTGSGGTICPTLTPHTNGFDATLNNGASMFTYNPSGAANARWTSISNTNATSLIPGNGYRVIVRGNRATQGCLLLDGSTQAPQAVTLSATGTLAQGDVAVTLQQGYNLVGNPYQAPINFNTIATDNSSDIAASYWTYNPANAAGT